MQQAKEITGEQTKVNVISASKPGPASVETTEWTHDKKSTHIHWDKSWPKLFFFPLESVNVGQVSEITLGLNGLIIAGFHIL